MMAFAKYISIWGIASLALLVGGCYLADYRQYPQFSGATGFELCAVLQLAAAVCGVVAMRRGSRYWLWTVVPAALLALACYFGEL